MFEWIATLGDWLQSWMSPQAGLWGVFLSALLSATILPGSSEVVLAAMIAAYPEKAWAGLLVATLGNVTGGVTTYWMGHFGRQGYERFQRVTVDLGHPRIQRLRRWGPPGLFLSFLPLVGDALVLAAGWLRMPFWHSMLWVATGKATRYLMLILGMLGLLEFA